MRHRIPVGILAAIAGGALLTGVVSAAEIGRSANAPMAEQASSVNIEMGDYYFSPSSSSLSAGSVTILAKNVGEKRHNLIIEGNGVYKAGRDIGFGGQDSFTIDLTAGSYRIFCDLGDHVERGMVGTLTVSAPAAPPAEAPPADVPPAEVPPAEVPPAEVPPADAPPADAPPADAPPADAPPAEGA
ncbi:MAG: cupredoxin domain-containing protein [Dehalococcoidia bacterium]